MTNIPKTMRCIDVPAPGGADAMILATRPTPAPRAGEILIRVQTAGVNHADLLQREGAYPPPEDASDILGLEVAGQVVAVGEGASLWNAGDKVTALLPGGGYAEYVCAHESHALPVPDSLSIEEAGCLCEAAFTVWTNVFERGALKRGETFLVHGGSSGIGAMAIQMARAFGARVFATVGSPAKAAFCETLGAERAIPYRDEDFVEALRGATGGKGADVILDMVGGDYIPRNVRCAAIEGRIVNIAFLGGAEATLNFARVMVKRLTLTGSTLRPRSVGEKAAIARALRKHVWPLVERGAIVPPIDSLHALGAAADAHRRMETSAHMGKIALRVS